MGGDTQNYESFQPANISGFFVYRVPCNGTLVAVNATGFCILTGRTHQHVSLFLVIYREDNGIPMPTSHEIPADCEFVKNTTTSGIDYSFGNVSDNDLNIPVNSDELLGIGFYKSCASSLCTFQPAIINEESNHILSFLEYNKSVNEANLKDSSNVSLLFSATIETSSGKRGIMHDTIVT